ncbi:class I SAM-dependent methyltransferase [Streptomyces rubellomurinus]|uniref:class I SAM-dependent methyltransferase n=1 Tax=Streptomyces rubellomurinus (strain ATCC 31215) TaxID=359131 RepID=UPI000697440C|nr:class I SAM-dependent methyltransferase [Streptomyces rubellomurinus]
MAHRLAPVAEQVVRLAGVTAGAGVLDVGTGTGNAALAAARRGALVTGADPTPELLALASERAAAEGLPVVWQELDAERITGRYDRVLSVFGAMYAPHARSAADAMIRCCAPGGRVVSAAWTPGGFMAATNHVFGRFLPPPPPGGQPPTRWGDPEFLRTLFPGEPTCTVERIAFAFGSPAEAAGFWIRAAGHVQVERARLVATGRWDALHEELATVFAEWNRQPRDGTEDGNGTGVRVEAEYLVAVVHPH